MKNISKEFDWKLFKVCLWIEILLAYVLPFNIINELQVEIGFPISFITIGSISFNPMMSMSLNPLDFVFNGFIIYFILSLIKKLYQKIVALKNKRRNKQNI